MVKWHGIDGQCLIALRFTISGTAMVAHDPQHGLCIGRVAGEGAQLLGHFSRGFVADAGHDCRDGSADGAAFGGIIGNAG